MCSQKCRKKNKPFVPRDKNDQICTTTLYIHNYILWFSYTFKVCSKSVSESWYIRLVIVVGAMIIHKMFEAGKKHLPATDDHLKVFLGPCGWRNSILKSPSCTFTSVICQLTKMYCRYSWHMKITWCFLYLFLQSMIYQNQIEETLHPQLWKWWLCLVPGIVFDFAKQCSRSLWTLTVSSRLTSKNVMEGVSLTHRSSIDW